MQMGVDIKYKPFTPQNSISGYELEGHELLCERLTWCVRAKVHGTDVHLPLSLIGSVNKHKQTEEI